MHAGKHLVRARRMDTFCGGAHHMTAEEIKARFLGEEVDLRCPVCGRIHLTPEDAEAAAAERVVDSPEYARIVRQSIVKE